MTLLAEEHASHGVEVRISREASCCNLEVPGPDARVGIHHHDHVTGPHARQHFVEGLVECTALSMVIGHRHESLVAELAGDFGRAVAAVVGHHDDALWLPCLLAQRNEGRRQRRLLVMRRNEDRDRNGPSKSGLMAEDR
ncbi:unannotated protein [freshwater metagenome]|uniref:Unannotated protein n=1 Tax=freshwater metagenome TaxID=449393 RepID=A0A6J7EHJ0_9ZZZZ